TALHGVVQSFRLEDFIAPPPPADPASPGLRPTAGAVVSYVPGASSGLELTSRLIGSDRAEAFPRKIKILVQDSRIDYATREEFKELGGASVTSASGDFEVLSISLARDFEPALQTDPARTYSMQRITVENVDLDMRWSADATVSQPAQIKGIVARENDRIRVIRNQTTYGVVALFGYGVGVYDLNAIESNDAKEHQPGYKPLREQVRLTNAARAPWCGPTDPEAIPDLTFTPDAMVVTRPGSSDLQVYALDAARGVLDLRLKPPVNTAEGAAPSDRITACAERAPVGLVFRTRNLTGQPTPVPGGDAPTACDAYFHHPRLRPLCNAFLALEGDVPFGRFTGAAFHRWTVEAADNVLVTPAVAAAPGQEATPALGLRGTVPYESAQRDYMLIPGNEYGLLVVAIPEQGWLEDAHLADIIWIPHGAYAVRTVPGTNLASVVDGRGHVLLVDLSQIDERWDSAGPIGPNELFRTVRSLLSGPGGSITKPDPRIVWRSATPLATGTLAPVVDPNTGFVFVGKVLEATTEVVAATDPRMKVMVDVGAANGLSEVGGLVPLGIEPPKNVTMSGGNASLGAFRL
ncbi:MAG TPA: hypothetical protein VF911_18535, partial [Thermoanaerobaculia bacterium]